MNTLELSHFLHNDAYVRSAFQGVYAIDCLPSDVKYPCAIVINTDTCEGVGKHWTALYIDSFKCGVYFDSFGLPPIHGDHLVDFLRHHTVKWTYNPVPIQPVFSLTCGLYCLYFLHQQGRGLSLFRLLRPFDRLRLLRNDHWVGVWYSEKNLHQHQTTRESWLRRRKRLRLRWGLRR